MKKGTLIIIRRMGEGMIFLEYDLNEDLSLSKLSEILLYCIKGEILFSRENFVLIPLIIPILVLLKRTHITPLAWAWNFKFGDSKFKGEQNLIEFY
jgi:hypothetical protein